MAKSRTNVTCYWTSNCFSKSPFCLSQIPNQYIIHADLARNKPEALVNILIVYSNKIHSCQTATAPRTAEKAIGLISKKKKKEIPLPEQHTFLYTSFLCRCFARLCSYLHVLFVLWRKFRMCWPVLDLFAAVFVVAAVFFFFFFFTAAHYNLGRCLFSLRAARKLSCSSSNEIYDSFAVFISRSSSFFCYQRQCRH